MAMTNTAEWLLRKRDQFSLLRVQATQRFQPSCLCGPIRWEIHFFVSDIYLKVSFSLNKSIAMAYMEGLPKW